MAIPSKSEGKVTGEPVVKLYGAFGIALVAGDDPGLIVEQKEEHATTIRLHAYDLFGGQRPSTETYISSFVWGMFGSVILTIFLVLLGAHK